MEMVSDELSQECDGQINCFPYHLIPFDLMYVRVMLLFFTPGKNNSINEALLPVRIAFMLPRGRNEVKNKKITKEMEGSSWGRSNGKGSAVTLCTKQWGQNT